MNTDSRPKPMTVADVMTRTVITAGAAATFHEMAELMQRHAVSALPILDVDGRVVGIVSEADLMPKEAAAPERHLWRRHPEEIEQVKAAGITAVDVMTAPVVSAKPGERLSVVARRMLDHEVKRLPVLNEQGRLAGIISRRDVLCTFRRDDEEIRRDVMEGVLPRWMGLDPATVDVSVAGGVVRLRGGIERRSEIDMLTHLISALDGVVSVESELRYSFDDSHVRPAVEARLS